MKLMVNFHCHVGLSGPRSFVLGSRPVVMRQLGLQRPQPATDVNGFEERRVPRIVRKEGKQELAELHLVPQSIEAGLSGQGAP